MFQFAWEYYNNYGKSISQYPGYRLIEKVINAVRFLNKLEFIFFKTCQEFDLPKNIFHYQCLNGAQMEIFAHFYLANLIDVKKLNSAAVTIQNWWRNILRKSNPTEVSF